MAIAIKDTFKLNDHELASMGFVGENARNFPAIRVAAVWDNNEYGADVSIQSMHWAADFTEVGALDGDFMSRLSAGAELTEDESRCIVGNWLLNELVAEKIKSTMEVFFHLKSNESAAVVDAFRAAHCITDVAAAS